MKDKYWHVSYVKKRGNGNSDDIWSKVLKNFHPFKAINQWNKDYDRYIFMLISFQEITEEEYNMFGDE